MRTLTALGFLAVALFLTLVVAQNQSVLAQRHVLVLDLAYLQIRFHPVRLDLLLVGSFAAGFLLAVILGTPSRVKGALERRKWKKEAAKARAIVPVTNEERSEST